MAECFAGEFETFFDVTGIGLEGGDEGPFRPFCFLEKFLWREGHHDFREVILAALFAGFESDGLPFFLLAEGIGGIELDDGSFGEQGNNADGTEFDGLLHNEIHVFPFRNGLDECERAGEAEGGGSLLQGKCNGVAGGLPENGAGFVSDPIKNSDAFSRGEAEDLERVAGFFGT